MADKIHTIIFDLDGTLSDSAILTMAAMAVVAPKHGLPVPEPDAVRRATGIANPGFYYALYPDSTPEKVFEMGQMVEDEELIFLQEHKDRLIFPGCTELLSKLKELGYKLMIASTGDNMHVYSILKETKIEGFFDEIRCAQPDKIEMLRDLLNGNDPTGYLMVGDMKKDTDGARANGIKSVGACYGYCLRELTDFDYYIDEPLQLLELL